MLALMPNEDIEMRLHVKCSGPTKKFGKGVFVMTNKRMLYDSYDNGLCFSHAITGINGIKDVGKHEFSLQWYESKRPYTFQAKIEKHYDWKPTAQDLYDRWLETLASYDPRMYDGWRCDNYGVVYNVYMSEYNENIRTGEYTEEMEKKVPPDKDWRGKWDVKVGKGLINLNMYTAITDLWHYEKEFEMVKELDGETYEDQRLYRRYLKFLAYGLDNNYQVSMGMLTPKMIGENFASFMWYVKRDAEFYERTIIGAKNAMKYLGRDEKAINTVRNYIGNITKLDNIYKYRDDSWVWAGAENPDTHADYVREPFRYQGTQEQFITRVTEEHAVRKRIHEIMDVEHKKFVWVKNFWFRVYELHGALMKMLRSGADISRYVPPTKFKPQMIESEMKIRNFEKNLREPF